jgi:hypothetical protein
MSRLPFPRDPHGRFQDIEKGMGEDKPIWENKVFVPQPILCDGSGPIALLRRWCRPFYSGPASAPSAAVV